MYFLIVSEETLPAVETKYLPVRMDGILMRWGKARRSDARYTP
jgi:hypothetical protein